MIASRRSNLTRHSTLLLSLTLLACGGGKPAESPTGAEEASAAEAPEAAEESAPAPESDTDEGEAADAPGGGGGEGGGDTHFKDTDTRTAKDTHGVKKSTLKPTKTEAHLKFVVVDKESGPIEGVVIALTGEDGKKHYTEETDVKGFAELLAPAGQKYQIVYLSLGREDVAASATIDNTPNLTQKLTLRYKGWKGETGEKGEAPRFILDGVEFDTGKATIRKESYPRLDRVVEYMTHKKRSRILIGGHTDNVGNKASNKALSENRAKACRDYLVKKGIDGSRIEAKGFGDERPLAPNDTPEGRQKNRRIEAEEL